MQFLRGICFSAALVSFACPLPAWAAAPTGQKVDTIKCDTTEGVLFHIHQHLALFDHGKPVPIPADVGRPLLGNCLYWVHTHTPDGLIHVESPSFRVFTLGNFFDIWGQPLTSSAAGPARCKKGEMRIFVDGLRFMTDPRHIELNQHTVIVIEAGPPYTPPEPFTDWQGQ